MTITLTIQLISTLALLTAWFGNRRRDRRELSSLAAELAACRSTLHEFMQETEATFAVLSRMVHKAEAPNGARVTANATSRVAPANTPDMARAAAAAAASAPALPARRGAGKKSQVLKLADTGMVAVEIASQLMIPQGEIDLILNLNGREARC